MTRHKAGKYLRISDDRAGLGLGVQRQDEDCTTLCQRLGWDIVDTYTDNDVSAYSGKRRPNYERMLDDIQTGRINAIVAWHPDRLHRSPKELEHFIDVIETTGAAIATVTAGEYDLSTSSGRMVARIVGAVARGESEHKSERIKRKHRQLAEAGERHGGGTRQYGYIDGATVDPDEACRVRDAAARVLAGDGLRNICADWNREGVATVTGRPWSQTVLRRALTAPSTAGLREHAGTLYPGAWPAILDEATWRQVRAVLLDPSRLRNGGVNARKYLLSGFLYCWRCNDVRLVARPSSTKVRGYVCASGPPFGGCGRLRIMAAPLEELMAEKLFKRVDEVKVSRLARARAGRGTGVASLEDEIAADEQALRDLAHDRYVARIVTPGQFAAASQTLEAKIAAARRRLARSAVDADAGRWAGHGHALADAWPQMTLNSKRTVLGSYIDRIVVGPGVRGLNTFDERRILPAHGGRVVWRDL